MFSNSTAVGEFVWTAMNALFLLAGLWMYFTSYTSHNIVFVWSFNIDENP